jgi:protein-glutamine gamma-glutamyltransferase
LTTLHRLTQINLAIVAVLGTLLLGSAQGSFALPVLAVVSASAALYWTDIRGAVRLGGALANLAALVAVAISVSEVVQADSSEQLVAIANLLIYLQTILLFQEKTVRVGWQLLSLSLLQVVVAAAIGESIFFGALVTLYLVCGLSGVALLCCYGESLAHGTPFFPAESKRKQGMRFFADTADNLSGNAATRTVVEPPKYFYGSLARFLCGLAIGSVAVAGLLFVAVPRYGEAKLMAQHARPGVGMTGFSDQVDLNSSGRRIFENNEIVMRMKLFADETEQPFSYYGDVYLRGGVAYRYEGGNWHRRRGETDGESARRDGNWSGVVRQQIEIEAMRHKRLFSVYPVVTTYGDPRIETEPLRRDSHGSRMDLSIGTTGFYRGEQHAATPNYLSRDTRSKALQLPGVKNHLWGGGSESDELEFADAVRAGPLSGLSAWAREAIASAELNPDDRIGIARTLEQRLRISGEFGYTLAMPERTLGMDPMEDFVTANRQGNCEFFASALVLMLRSQKIPARMVMGYRSADWNPLGGYLQVRQLHAHAWAEAYLEAEQVPEDMKLPGHDYSRGAWLRLDPTPNDESFATTDSNFGLWARMKNFFDHVDLLWRNYVIGFDRERQERLIYSPMDSLAHSARFAVADAAALLVNAFRALLGAVGWLGIAVCVIVLWLGSKAIARQWPNVTARSWLGRIGGWWRLPRWRGRAAKRAVPRVAFYERFERIAARAGFERLPQQTPLEFAQVVGGQLFDMPSGRIAARAPRQVVEAFYRVRYGGKSLADDERAAVEMALIELEHVLGGAVA